MTREEKETLLKRIYALPTEWADAGGSYGKGGPVGSDGAAMLWPEAVIDAINQFAEDNNAPDKQPDPITGLVPCEYCTDHKNLYDDKYTDVEMFDDFIHVDVSIQYEGWSFGFYINYCPMCGRKLEGRQ